MPWRSEISFQNDAVKMKLENNFRSRDYLKASFWKPYWFLSIRHWPNKGIVMHFQGFIFKKSFWIAHVKFTLWTHLTFETFYKDTTRHTSVISRLYLYEPTNECEPTSLDCESDFYFLRRIKIGWPYLWTCRSIWHPYQKRFTHEYCEL